MVFIGEPFQRSTFTVMESSREETPRATGAGHVQVQQQQQHYSIRNVNPIVVNAGGIQQQQQQQQQQHYSHPAASVIVQNAAVLGGGTAALVNMNNSSSPQHPGKYYNTFLYDYYFNLSWSNGIHPKIRKII